MKFNYFVALATASTALIGYFVYKKYKNHKYQKKKVIPRYDEVMIVIRRLLCNICEEFSVVYPLIIKNATDKKDTIELHEELSEKFIGMVEHSKKMSCETVGFTLEEFNKILEENEDDEIIEEYNKGLKTMYNVLIETNYPPQSLPSDFKNNEILKKLVTELILLWDKKISSLTEKLCIDSLYCHYEVLNILDKNDIYHTDFKELIIRIHTLYLNDVLQVARNHDYNFIEFYTALATNFHFRSKMILFHKACGVDFMHACSFLMCMDKYDEMDMNDSIKLFIDTTEKSFRKCKDFVNKRINVNESLNYKDLIKEKDFQKFDCFIMHNLWEENKMGEIKTYYDLMYTLQKNFDNDDFKTDIYNYSISIDIPYKFVMEYIKINCQLDQLGLVRQKSLFVDYNIIQRQAVSLVAMQLMDEKKEKDSYDLISNYIRILDDEEINFNSERIKNEIENKTKLLLELYSVDEDTLDIICFLFKNSSDVEIKKWKDDCINQLDRTMNSQLFFIRSKIEEEDYLNICN